MGSHNCWSGALDTWWFLTQPPRSCYDYRFCPPETRERERDRERKERETDRQRSGIRGREEGNIVRGEWMDAGDGWRVAGGETGAPDKTIINQIMLRFRPIAPKPAAGGSSSGPTSADGKTVLSASKRVKRKYIRVAKDPKNNNSARKLINSRSSTDDNPPDVVTLPLMPEKTDSLRFSGSGSWGNREIPTWKNLNHKMNRSVWNEDSRSRTDRAAVVTRVTTVESWVTVESVTDTCMEVRGLGYTDMDKMKSLDKDTCPGFISDGSNKVQWVNEAYKRMVSYVEGQLPPAEVVVWLDTKESLPYAHPMFSCRVRLQYSTLQKEKCSKTVPCDVWRMECGLAWRLDITAALSLGL
ncbi:uncharacterized protein LOC126582662 [Malus sylvestris]|uniref:uncharacterized protein LOC126582662 n=1 Tax=Malus sylvestris TaxID=3752 RepID=UPI0021ABCDF4|nr:uncharacterized protein LOC126582662 [Malus sylvestris]XP_050102780.1 uncharacterized protein LOC126582662 [Malus sylvestris]XP_050102781.1 uncharacterized protein LOC126582662 [Malus sylvestris]